MLVFNLFVATCLPIRIHFCLVATLSHSPPSLFCVCVYARVLCQAIAYCLSYANQEHRMVCRTEGYNIRRLSSPSGSEVGVGAALTSSSSSAAEADQPWWATPPPCSLFLGSRMSNSNNSSSSSSNSRRYHHHSNKLFSSRPVEKCEYRLTFTLASYCDDAENQQLQPPASRAWCVGYKSGPRDGWLWLLAVAFVLLLVFRSPSLPVTL